MSETQTASVREVRDTLADVIDRADRDQEVTIVTRRGRQVAAVVPVTMVEEWRQWEEEHVLAMIDKSMADPGPSIPMASIIAEYAAATDE